LAFQPLDFERIW